MSPFGKKNSKPIIGRVPEELTPAERFQYAGKWIALELYSPPVVKEEDGNIKVAFKLRRIRACGNSAQECIQQLQQAGLAPADFEYTRLTAPY